MSQNVNSWILDSEHDLETVDAVRCGEMLLRTEGNNVRCSGGRISQRNVQLVEEVIQRMKSLIGSVILLFLALL